MALQSLEEQFEGARFSENPFEALYAVAKSLRDIGVSQLALYKIFSELFHKHEDDKDTTFFDTITDVLECIWGGGWGGSRQLFETALTDNDLRTVTVDVCSPITGRG